MEEIHFKDATQVKNWLPTVAGVVFCAITAIGVLNFNEQFSVWFALSGMVGLSLIGIPQIKYIRVRNVITIYRNGLTFKLVGHKTFGLSFKDVKQVQLTPQDLQIITLGEEFALSRKQYQLDSLEYLKELIEQKG